jgi:hypothetical protein
MRNLAIGGDDKVPIGLDIAAMVPSTSLNSNSVEKCWHVQARGVSSEDRTEVGNETIRALERAG